jgi:glutamate racemase
MIETNQIDQDHIRERIELVLDQNTDVIILGCTHYHWIESLIKQLAGDRAQVLQPEIPVIEQLQRVLQQLP